MKHTRLLRRSIEEKDKKIIRFCKRLYELRRAEREIPLVPLPKPIQRGFKKSFKLREDISRRNDAHIFKRILGVINTTVYCKTQDFKVKKYHSNQLTDIPHSLDYISEYEWGKLNWPQSLKKWFILRSKHIDTKYGLSRIPIKGYYFSHPYFFDTKIEPHFVTHTCPVDVNIKREIAEIEAFMTNNSGWARLGHLKGYTHRQDKIYQCRQDKNKHREALRLEMAEFEANYLDAPFE